jgi:hypothetical protein
MEEDHSCRREKAELTGIQSLLQNLSPKLLSGNPRRYRVLGSNGLRFKCRATATAEEAFRLPTLLISLLV